MKNFPVFPILKPAPALAAALALAASNLLLPAEEGEHLAPAAPPPAERLEEVEILPGEVPSDAEVVEIQLSPPVQEVVRLALSGVGEEVILAFIRTSRVTFDLSPEEIIYLADIGIPEEIITEMLQRSEQAVKPAPEPAPTVAPSRPPMLVEEETEVPPVHEYDVATPQVVYVTPPAQVNYATFYTHLSPYGAWFHDPAFGMVWQPKVAVIDTTWAPYRHRGRWMYTTYGWYWHSDYTWGWAPFHYGRWHLHPARGWIWCPDTIWGPAWVTWRKSPHFYGWAPLPPAARFHHGVGLTFHSASVGLHFGFGLHRHHFTFVPARRFCDPHPWKHVVPRTQVVNIFNQSTVINNFNLAPNGTIINEGIGRDTIAAATRSEIRKVEVRESSGDRRVIPGRLGREGDQLVVYRPESARSESGRSEIARRTDDGNRLAPAGDRSAIRSHRAAGSDAAPDATSIPGTVQSPSAGFAPTRAPSRGELRQAEGRSPAITAETKPLESRGAAPTDLRGSARSEAASVAAPEWRRGSQEQRSSREAVQTPSLAVAPNVHPVHPSQAASGSGERLVVPHYRLRTLPAQGGEASAKPLESRSATAPQASSAQAVPPRQVVGSRPLDSTIARPASPAQVERGTPTPAPRVTQGIPAQRQPETRLSTPATRSPSPVTQTPSATGLQLQRQSPAPIRAQTIQPNVASRQALPSMGAPLQRQEIAKPQVAVPRVNPGAVPSRAPSVIATPQPAPRALPQTRQVPRSQGFLPSPAPSIPSRVSPTPSAPVHRPQVMAPSRPAQPHPRVATPAPSRAPQPQIAAPQARTPSIRSLPQNQSSVPSRGALRSHTNR
jgi:hypothetical protein